MLKFEGDFMMEGIGFMDMGMFSNSPNEMAKDPGRPERPFPLRPGNGFDKGFASEESDRPPVTDDDFIFYAANISNIHIHLDDWNRAHDAFEAEFGNSESHALNAQVEGDFYGRNSR